MAFRSVSVLCLSIALVAACYRPDFAECAIRCGAGTACPADLVCSHGWCGQAANACAVGLGGGPPCATGSFYSAIYQSCMPAGDLNGDGRADLVSVNDSEIDALLSTGSGFTLAKWLDGHFQGYGGAYTVDVTGDGYADGVAFLDISAWVATTHGPGFGTETNNVVRWSEESLIGDKGTFVADVDGDNRGDVVVLNDDRAMVALSNGTRFDPSVVWRTGDFGQYIFAFFADVNGDRRADGILFRLTRVDVMLSNGKSFEAPEEWYPGAFNGLPTFFADVDGDGRADGIRMTDDAVFVALSTGAGFAPEQRWYAGPPTGGVFTVMGDVSGDEKADIVQINSSDVSVSLSTGVDFAAPVVWYAGQFDGTWDVGIAPDQAGARAGGQ